MRFELLQPLKQLQKFLVGNSVLIRFIVDREEVHGLLGHQHVGNYPSPTRFAFPLRGDRQAYLVAILAKRSTLPTGASLNGVGLVPNH